ncbi:MAG: cytochrome B [Marinosulfonomonas sp.]|nr:MAG: cytochrome B [Marinosulfonomonas sp.]
MVRVWDPLVRIFHWALVLSFAIAWISAESLDDLHIWAGYAAAALIGFRLIWGLIGPRYARFTQFIKGPGTVLGYLKSMLRGSEPRYVGHNPVGGAMILALLTSLGGTSWTGWLLTLPKWERSDWLEEGHEIIAGVTLALVVLHIVGVIVASWRHRENLVLSMVNGQKRSASPDEIA